MYNPQSTCSALVHLLLKYPVLVVALGLTVAVKMVMPATVDQSNPAAIESVERRANQLSPYLEKTEQAEKYHQAILNLESAGEVPLVMPQARPNEFSDPDPLITAIDKYYGAIIDLGGSPPSIGRHPDGVSYGPAGLTEETAKDLLAKLPDCETLGVNNILYDPEINKAFGKLYFLDLTHRFGDVRTATVAYNSGPSRVSRLKKAGKPLPSKYLDMVERRVKALEKVQ